MDDKLREAFDQIKAENELKQKTKDFIMEKTRGYTRVKLVNYRRFASAFVCIALLLMGGALAVFYAYRGNQHRYQSVDWN